MKLSVESKTIKYILAFLPFLTISSYLLPHLIVQGLQVYRSIVCAFYILYYVKGKKYSIADILFFLAHLTILLSTFIHGGETRNQLYRTISVIGFCAMCRINLEKNPKCFLKAIAIYGGILSILTTLSMYVYYKPGNLEGGMRQAGTVLDYGRLVSGNWYLLGLDNSSFFYIYSILIIICVYMMIYKKRVDWKYYLLYFFITSAFFYVDSTTAMVCFLFGGIALFIINNDKVRTLVKLIDYKKAILILILFTVGIVIFRLQYILESIIVGLLDKSLTLTRRTAIWDVAFKQILKNPIIGIGAQSDSYNYMLFRVNHVHNIILEWLYEGGIISLGTFVASIIYYGKKINKYRNHPISRVISSAVAIYLFNTCLDFYTYVFLPYVLFQLIGNIEILINAYDMNSFIRHKKRKAAK